jgi:ribose/xylose/arabinose/galactoside ABC-type transport system permease subunit
MESVKGFKKFFSQKMLTLLFLLAVVVAAFSALSKGTYLNPINIRAILNQMVITMMLTLGVGCLMISGSIDLSTGAIGTLCGMLFALFLRGGMPWFAAFPICLAVGMILGAFNATLVNIVGFQPFIATMAVASVTEGLTYVFSAGAPVDVKDDVVSYIGTGRIFDVIPTPLIIAAVLFVVYALMLGRSKFGRTIYLVGGNHQAAYLSGIDPTKTSYLLFMNAGMLSAFAGMLLAARMKSATVTGTTDMQFSGMTAAMLGGISFGGGSGGFGGVLVGLLIINGFNNGLTVMRVSQYWKGVASGILLLFALTVDFLSQRRKLRKLVK